MALFVFAIVLIVGSWWLGRLMTQSGYNDGGGTHGQDGFNPSIDETASHPFD